MSPPQPFYENVRTSLFSLSGTQLLYSKQNPPEMFRTSKQHRAETKLATCSDTEVQNTLNALIKSYKQIIIKYVVWEEMYWSLWDALKWRVDGYTGHKGMDILSNTQVGI